MSSPDLVLDCLIVGGGPAGLTAALYLARFERRVLVVDGGQARAASIPLSHNIPLFPHGISGPDLLTLQRDGLAAYGPGIIRTGEVVELERRAGGGFRASLQDNGRTTVEARHVLIATGAQDVEPELGNVKDAVRRGLVRYCPVCDGYEARDKDIAVVGTGKRGLGEAVFVARTYGARVTFLAMDGDTAIDPRERTRADRFGVRVLHAPVEFMETEGNAMVLGVAGGTLRFDTIYSALGLSPRAELARDLGAEIAQCGSLVVDDHQQTSVPGLYAAGGVVRGLDQIVVAMGHAAVAATRIHNRCDATFDEV